MDCSVFCGVLQSIFPAAYIIFHHHLIGPGWYGNPAVILSAYVLCVAMHLCLEALEVHPLNICQGSSVITSAKSKGERDSSAEKDLWRYIREREAIKRDGKKGDCGGKQRVGCKRALPVGINPSDRTLGSCSVNTCHSCWSIYPSVSDAFFHNSELCRHWSTLQRINIRTRNTSMQVNVLVLSS